MFYIKSQFNGNVKRMTPDLKESKIQKSFPGILLE